MLANGFIGAGHEVILAVDHEAQENHYLLKPGVRLIVLGKSHALSIIKLALLIKREQPDITFSAIGSTNLKHVLAAILSRRLKTSIISIHGYYESEPQLLNRIAYYLTPILTRLTASTICVSQGLLDYMITIWHANKEKTRLIYNPVYYETIQIPETESDLLKREPIILASGRLVDYKNFARLIRAFARIKIDNARLLILGKGPEEQNLKKLINQLGLKDRVDLLGYVKEPWNLMTKARVLALSSDSEAFGLVIVEAMANGLAIVSTDCDGPNEILQKGALGAIVPREDEHAYSQALSQAITYPGQPCLRMERAKEFSEEIGISHYLNLFKGISAREIGASKDALKSDHKENKSLLFYTHALADGGAERVWALLASGFHRAGYKVVMVVDYELNDNISFLDPEIELIILKGNHLQNIVQLYEIIRDRRPDCILSALSISNLKSVIAASFAGQLKRTILSYHGFFETERQFLSRTSYLMTPILSRLSGHIVAVSDALLRDLKKRFLAAEKRTIRIYNPVIWGASDQLLLQKDLANRDPIVLACGRLVPTKCFDKLISIFSKVETLNARVIILGEGPERKSLEEMIKEFGLEERVSLPGYISQPWNIYENAKCFVLTSELESFGLVVVEALGHGLPVVSTDCYGPREILDQGHYGTLMKDWTEDNFASEIDRWLVNPGDPEPRQKRASEFRVDPALRAYGELVKRLADSD